MARGANGIAIVAATATVALATASLVPKRILAIELSPVLCGTVRSVVGGM